MASDKILQLTDATFQAELGKSALPVIVDFWATWCPPCKMVAPFFEQLADELAGQVVFAKINIDENPKAAGEYGVMSIPTFIVFRNGTVAGQFTGGMQKAPLKAKILEIVGKAK